MGPQPQEEGLGIICAKEQMKKRNSWMAFVVVRNPVVWQLELELNRKMYCMLGRLKYSQNELNLWSQLRRSNCCEEASSFFY